MEYYSKTAQNEKASRELVRRWFVCGETIGKAPPSRIDFQMHTRWTDGQSSVAEMIESAVDKHFEAIAITEHVNERSVWFPQFALEVKMEREKCRGLEIYFGAEIAAADYDGRLKVDPVSLGAELVLGVVHRYPKRNGNGFWAFDQLTRDDAIELEIRALAGIASNRSVDVLGHPGGTAYKKFGAFPIEWLEPVFCTARDNGIAVELNTKYAWDLPGMMELLRRVNPMVSFGSDAHCAADVGLNHTVLIAEHPQHIRLH